MSPEEIDKILQRYLNDQATPHERQLVEEWFEAIGEKNVPVDVQEQRAIQHKLWSSLNPAQTKRRIYLHLTGMAAAILLVVVSTSLLVVYFTKPGVQDTIISSVSGKLEVVRSGETEKRVELADGSVVELQPWSEISFVSAFTEKREVFLSGEALFNVSRDVNRPFLVHANELTTQVLGTSFLIKAYHEEKEVTVTVKSGKVSVYTKQAREKKEIILTPNQQVVFNRSENQVTKKLVDNPQIIEQQAPVKTMYTNVPVAEIFKALEQQYGIQIQYDSNALSGCTLTYADLTDEDLYGQIEIICNALGGLYKKSESSILVEAQGCK